ncbi:MAG TPA: hypothetical protein VGJ09_00430 [Bryobacteraceae bacterium]
MFANVRWLLLPLAALLLSAAPTDLTGKWKVVFDGDPKKGPKTVGSILLDLSVEKDVVTGMVHIGSWPGDAPIADGKIENGHITFNATGHLSSTTGIPTCAFDVTVHDDEMRLAFRATENAAGLGQGKEFHYVGKRQLD